MPLQCAAYGCDSLLKKGCGISFFSFPKDLATRKKWIHYTKRKFEVKNHHRLCSQHFSKAMLDRDPEKLARYGYVNAVAKLKIEAVPDIPLKVETDLSFLQSKQQQQVTPPRSAYLKRQRKQRAELSPTAVSQSSDIQSPPTPVHLYKVQTESDQTPAINLQSIIKTEPFVDPTQETQTFGKNLKSGEITVLSTQFSESLDETLLRNVSKCRDTVYPAIQVSPEDLVTPANNRALETDFDSSPLLVLNPTHVHSDVNHSDIGNPVKIEAITDSTSNLYSTIQTKPFGDPTQVTETFGPSQTSGEVAASLQHCGSRDTTLLNPKSVFGCQSVEAAVQVSPEDIVTATRNNPVHFVPKCQFVDEAVQVSPEDIVTATGNKSKTVQTDFDPSTLIVLDPTRVIVLDQSQASEFQGSEIPGFDPTEIPGFDPSRIPGYDPCQDYRAVFVQRDDPVCPEPMDGDDPVCQEPQEPMDGDIPQSSEIQEMNVSSKRTPLQNLICSAENVLPNVEEVIRFTQNVEIARDKALEALKVLQESGCTCRSRVHKFMLEMQKMVDTARNDVIKMIKQLAETTKQQQTQFLHLAGRARKLHEEQSEIEGQLVKFRESSLTVRCPLNRKRRLPDEYIKNTKFRKIIHSSTKVSKIGLTKEDVEFRPIHTVDLSQEVCSKKPTPGQETVSPAASSSEATKNQALRNSCRTNVSKVRTKQQVNCDPKIAEFYQERKHVKRKRVTMSLVQRSPELCEKYTGFSNSAQLKDVFNEIVKDPNFTPKSAKDSGKSAVRKLSLESEFLMTLVKIKMMVPECYLCSQYKVSRSVVRETVAKWTGVLFRALLRNG